MNFELSRQSKMFLLKTARCCIKSGQDRCSYDYGDIPEELNFNSGCFVTLHLRGRLRGCIGTFRNDENIVKNVSEMACQAAFADPRFGPVSKDELGMVEIEISVLSPMVKTTADDIKVGRDGIYIVKGSSRGVLLPQVATERRWDEVTFLEETCVKAGLPMEAYKEPDTDIFRFEALIFSENNLK